MAKKWICAICVLVLLVCIGRLMSLSFLGAPMVGASQRITVEANEGVGAIANRLAEQGIISSARWYRAYAVFSRTAKQPKPGSYLLQPGESFAKIAATFALGPESDEVQVRVIEGWTIADIATALQQRQDISPETIFASVGKSAGQAPFDVSWREKFPFLQALPAQRSLEGYLFPDTYRVWRGQLPTGLISKQLTEFQQRIAGEAVTDKSAPLKTLDEVVILASIVEKEVANPNDRKMVAGIFLRRLREGIPLQSDATVNYLTRSGRARSTADDLSIESPYNTYRVKGLPPGPISNPSEGSLRAVLDPTPSPYRYFLTDEQGKIYYGRTLEEHIANRRKAGY